MNTSKNPKLSSILLKLPTHTDNLNLLVRLLHPDTDLTVIYEWVNQPYAIPFWQMDGPIEQLWDSYKIMTESYTVQSLAGNFHGKLICQLDIYDPSSDPIQDFYQAAEGDLGIHLLMAPGEKPVKDLTAKVLYFILSVLFQSPLISRIIGEPDEKNEAANRLLTKLSFHFHQRILLPTKAANFYTLTKDQFNLLPSDLFSI